ncbi:MAG: GAF domain-containing protein [Anaerolineales bacterium]
MVEPRLLKSLKEEIADLKQDNYELREQNDRLWKVIKSLNDLRCDVGSYSSPDDILKMVMDILVIALEAVESENGSILLLDDESDELVFVAVVGDRQEELMDFRIPANSGVAGWVKNHKKPALVQDVRKDDRWISAVDQSIGFHTQSLMAVPLILEDQVLGVMEVVNTLSEDHFNLTDLALLQLIARLASFVFGCTEDALNNAPELRPGENLN